MKDVIELAKQAGIHVPTVLNTVAADKDGLIRFAKLVGNAKLTEAIDKARIFGLGLPIADTERLIKALESLKEPTL